jgi:ribonuclease E
LLGLERLLSEDEPKLADGTVLSAHQVDALSGTLAALLAAAQNGSAANGKATAGASPELLASADILGPDTDGFSGGGVEARVADRNGAAATSDEDEDEEDEDDVGDDEEPDEDDDEDEAVPAAPEDDDEDFDDDEELLGELDGNGGEDAEGDIAAESDDDVPDWVEDEDPDAIAEAPEDPNAAKRFWFEHATGAGKTVAALGFVEASQTGGVLILTHRRNLVDQFHGELRDRGYAKRISRALLKGEDAANGPVTVETYQWFVRNAGEISSAYTIVICDEAHTALGEKTSAAIRAWTGPLFIGMTATGALIARHVTDLFPTQTSRFDLALAARRGVIAPLRCVRISPGVGVRTIAKVPLRRGEVDTEFDQEELAKLLDQQPFNVAVANLYKTRFNGVPGVVYAAGVRHAYNLAEAFQAEGIKARAVSGETPKRELAEILAAYERGDIDVLINAQLLAEGWNSPRATVCMHLAPTASKRIYQQRVGRVTRRHPGKEAGLVVDFVHPATKHDDPVVTLHSLLDRDVYRGGAIVVGPVRRGRGRRMRVERRVLPVCAEEERRFEVFERELWRIAVEHLDYGEQHVWAALAGARVTPSGWRRARAMLHFDRTGELKARFLTTAVQRNKNPQLRLRALSDIPALRDADTFDTAIDIIGGWPRDERREATKIMLRALVERRIGRRDQANAWIWRLAGYTREIHEEYAVQRWPETKRLLGLLVNSSGGAHARNARRLIHAARKQDRRLAAALLAAALAHTPEAEEALRGARTRMARKPPALARELLRNFPKRRARNARRRRRGAGAEQPPGADVAVDGALTATGEATEQADAGANGERTDTRGDSESGEDAQRREPSDAGASGNGFERSGLADPALD